MTALRGHTLFAVLAFCVACGGSDRPTAPTAVPIPPPVPPVVTSPPPRAYPPLSGPGIVFEFSGLLSYPVSDYTRNSRYVLYDSGTFAFQYLAFDAEYVGSYLEDGAGIRFIFGPRSEATGIRKGDFLEVRYNDSMQQADFEDAVYKR
jgi:hypothetical protein